MESLLKEHAKLSTESGIHLGQLFWLLQSADQRMEQLSNETYVDSDSTFPLPLTRRTEFGSEVGNDEVLWWIYKRDPNVRELLSRAQRALKSSQALKVAASQLKRRNPETYAELLERIALFLSSKKVHVKALLDFVVWLRHRDRLAPVVMYSYRVWGTTRRSNRRVAVVGCDVEAQPTDVIQRMSEVACGLWRSGLYSYAWEYGELDLAVHEADPERYVSGLVDQSVAESRTAARVLDELEVFFTQLRDSLRAVEAVAQQYLAGRDLLRSEGFWSKFILKAKDPRRTENTVWDFKKTLTMWHTKGRAKSVAKVEFCSRFAAFANNQGGVIVVGVDNMTRAFSSVAGIENRVKSVLEVIQQSIDYPRMEALVHVQAIPVTDNGKVSQCLVVVAAQAADVVGVRDERSRYIYPDRVQSGTTYVERSVIERRKMRLNVGDNFGFLKQLEGFVYDR